MKDHIRLIVQLDVGQIVLLAPSIRLPGDIFLIVLPSKCINEVNRLENRRFRRDVRSIDVALPIDWVKMTKRQIRAKNLWQSDLAEIRSRFLPSSV